MPDLHLGCWIETRFEGEAVVVEIDQEKGIVWYRYAAIPFRNGKPQVLEQTWVLKSDTLNGVKFLYPSNVVSAAVLELKGPYGKGEVPVEPDPFDEESNDTTLALTFDDKFLN